MAISGGAKPCVSMQVIDNELYTGRQEMTTVAQSDIDLIVQRLAQGEKVYVAVYGDLPSRVQKTIAMMLSSG
jgi:hypothetical protein